MALLNDLTITRYREMVWTDGYADPEYLSTKKYQSSSDIYSFGIVLLELLTGQPAVSQRSNGLCQ